jgi:hypothetical protein
MGQSLSLLLASYDTLLKGGDRSVTFDSNGLSNTLEIRPDVI